MNLKTMGYKIFNSDWMCHDYQYQLGPNNIFTGPLILEQSGLHYSEQALDCLRYYIPTPKHKYAEVRALGIIVSDNLKSVTNHLELIRELTYHEFLKLCNGLLITYYSTQRPKTQTTYKQGIKSGPYLEWYDTLSCQIKTRGYYLDNRAEGLFESWTLHGAAQSIKDYKKGKMVRSFPINYCDGEARIKPPYSYPPLFPIDYTSAYKGYTIEEFLKLYERYLT